MKKILAACLIFCSSVYACDERGPFDSLMKNRDYCISMENFPASVQCQRDAWMNYQSTTCMNAGRLSASNQIFILTQMSYVIQDGLSGKVKREIAGPQLLKLANMSMEEYRNYFRTMTDEINDIERNRVASENISFMNSVIRSVGGAIQPQKNSTTTYILNGRIINCTNMGSVVTCN